MMKERACEVFSCSLFGLYCFIVVFAQSVENKIDNNTDHKYAGCCENVINSLTSGKSIQLQKKKTINKIYKVFQICSKH